MAREHHGTDHKNTGRFMTCLCCLRREEDDDKSPAEAAKEAIEPLFNWSAPLMDDFRLQLEKLIVLDVLMRNTDRGAFL